MPCVGQNTSVVCLCRQGLYQAEWAPEQLCSRHLLVVQRDPSQTHCPGRTLQAHPRWVTNELSMGAEEILRGRSGFHPDGHRLWLPLSTSAGPSFFILLFVFCESGSCVGRLIGTMERFARCNFKGHISHCATIKMQRVRRSLYFFAIQLLKCAEIRFIGCNCQQLAV